MDWQPLRPGSRFALWHSEAPREEEQESWLITYLDMITLLLVMLVVLLAFAGKGAAPATEAPPAASSAVATPSVAAPSAPAPETAPQAPVPTTPAAAMPELDMDLGEDIEVVVNEGSVSFRISSELLFASGRAELADAGLEVIDRLIPALAANRHRILVEGHTDDRPIATERFPSNWELSASRASSVVRYLTLAGLDPARMSATGYADTRPLAQNSSEQGRASNRRVELIMQTRASDDPSHLKDDDEP